MADNSLPFELNPMATYAEQIVKIKKSAAASLLVIGIWILTFVLFFLLMGPLYTPLSLILCFAIAYGAYWLTTKFNVEFEYIITNGVVDIDKIINKSSRKRILSFDLKNTTRLEKYNPSALVGINQKEILFAANIDDGAYFISAEKTTGGNVYVVFSPNQKLQAEIKKFAPRFITGDAFK